MEKIDFVIIWVDGSDSKWKEEKAKYEPKKDTDSRDIRYRDWENLKYLFRGIEKFTPWVNKVHFVTCGHLPNWLNVKCEKLNVVKHSDYIPEEYLPTFSSHPIELNLHRIKNLSEHFVYFNDDMFILDNMKKEDFFRKGLPCESAILNPVSPAGNDIVENVFFNNTLIINKNFNKKDSLKSNLTKWFNLKYGIELYRTIACMGWSNFLGFRYTHLPASFLKSTFVDLWDKEFEILNNTSKHKFRSKDDVSQYLFKDWQIASGNFYPRKYKIGKFFEISNDVALVCSTIEKQKYKMICINDSEINEEEFQKYKKIINSAFEKILPDKSAFEL